MNKPNPPKDPNQAAKVAIDKLLKKLDPPKDASTEEANKISKAKNEKEPT